MSKTANFAFFGFGYENNVQILNNDTRLKIEGQYGETHYSGTGATRRDKTVILTTQFEKIWSHSELELSAGLGYRFLYDFWGNQKTTTGLPTYDRKSEYLFGSIGANFELINGRSLAVQYRNLLIGNQTSYTGGLISNTPLTKRQSKGFGATVEWELHQGSVVFLDYWSISSSAFDSQGHGFYEPANSTTQFGIRHRFSGF